MKKNKFKHISTLIITIMICVITFFKSDTAEHCNALNIWDQNQVRQMIAQQVGYTQDYFGQGIMTNGAYQYGQTIERIMNDKESAIYDKIGEMQQQIGSLQGNVGASSEEINKVNDNVSNVNTKVDNVQDSIKNINLKKDLDEYYESKGKNDGAIGNKTFEITASLIAATNSLWNSVGDILVGATDGTLEFMGFSLDVDAYAQSTGTSGVAYKAMLTLAYGIVLLFFAINLVETTVKYEMITVKGILVMIVRIVVAKTLIDNAGTICIKIMDILFSPIADLVESSESYTFLSNDTFVEYWKNFSPNNSPVVGSIIDFFMASLMVIPIILTLILVGLVSIILLVKLLLWSVELAVLVATSPVYISCWSSDVTKQYCKNFIITFIQVTAQLLYMVLVYSVFRTWLSSFTLTDIDVTKYLLFFGQNFVVVLAMAIMIIKPPKVLTNLIR